MATPPPEATPVVKEEKPQLPPSPTGVSAPDVPPKRAQDAMDTEPDAAPGVTDANPAPLNGHTPAASSIANGSNASASPKSPALPTAADNQLPASAQTEAPSTAEPIPAEEGKGSEIKDTPAQVSAASTPANPVVKEASPALQAPPGASSAPPEPTNGPADAKEMAIDGAPAQVNTDLPHHLTTDIKISSPHGTDGTYQTNLTGADQTGDQEMKDAPDFPPSPSKAQRERELDPNEEPAAKRTKVDGEDFKAPELPTPATETSGPILAGGESGLTKMQHKFFVKSLATLKRMHDSRFYREPVDPIKLNIPHYPNFIKQPMDLGTMEKKLKANEYLSPQAVVDDLYLMVQNALTFNGPDHPVTTEGQKLKATFDKQLLSLPKPDEVEEKKKKVAEKTSAARRPPRTSGGQPKAASPQSTTFALGPEGLPVIRRDSANTDGRPKRSIHPPKRDLPYSTKPKKKKFYWELRFCQEVLEELHKAKHRDWVFPFYVPVDPVALNIPTYHSVIKKPMDLSTVQSKLRTGQYENSKEFENDVRLIFKNCFRFNIPGDPTYLAGQKTEEIFNSKWAQKQEYVDTHDHANQEQSDSSDEDSDDEEEETEEDERLSMLQKQIAEMSRQVEAITSKKKKTPPSSKKAGKAKSGKKDSRKSGGAKKDKKSTGSKADKPRWVSYNEKQIISNGISSLPDKKMQEALKIIQNNVPALKGTQEAEIELDIDELPNDVLLMLLKFVKKNAPQVMEGEESPPPSNVAAPKPKKNKPMSKYEQEAQINMLKNNLSRFESGARSPDPVPSVEANESSDDDSDDSEESEEE